jgi:hypothetical protein
MSGQIIATAPLDQISTSSGSWRRARLLLKLFRGARSPRANADRADATRLSGAGIFYLTSLGLVAAATVAAFFSAGFFLLVSPAGETISGSSGVATGALALAHSAASDRRPAAAEPEKSEPAPISIGFPAAAAAVQNGGQDGWPHQVQPDELTLKATSGAVGPPPNAVAHPPAAPAGAPPSPRLSNAEINELLGHGDTVLRTGDVASARLFYERAAAAGDGRAALRLGVTFDPGFLARLGLAKVQADEAAARSWYSRALDLGVPEAKGQLTNLDPPQGQ